MIRFGNEFESCDEVVWVDERKRVLQHALECAVDPIILMQINMYTVCDERDVYSDGEVSDSGIKYQPIEDAQFVKTNFTRTIGIDGVITPRNTKRAVRRGRSLSKNTKTIVGKARSSIG